MTRSSISFLLLSVMLTPVSGYSAVNDYDAEVAGGQLHIHGRVIAGACLVTSDNVDMHVDMGQFRLHSFKQTEDIATSDRSFTIRLAECKSEISAGINIALAGRTNSQKPNLFEVDSGDEESEHVDSSSENSDVGLLISDMKGRVVMPKGAPVIVRQEHGQDAEIHYTAHYLASSLNIHPEALHSEIRLDIAYP